MSDRDDGNINVFDGVSGLQCDVFVRTVRQTALVQGQHRDDEWIAHYCASRLEGPALRWYEELPDETQESWKLLRRAMLVRWPEAATTPSSSPIFDSASTPSSAHSRFAGIPTPAAAPPPSGTAPNSTLTSKFTISSAPQQGKIMIVGTDEAVLGWVSPSVSSTGHLGTCQNIENALIVEFTPSPEPHEILLVSDRHLGTLGKRIGVTWAGHHDHLRSKEVVLLEGEKHYTWGGLVLAAFDQTSKTFTSSSLAFNGETRCNVWRILADGTLFLLWEVKPGVHCNLSVNLTLGIQSLNFAFDHDTYVGSAPSNWAKVRLVFQPV